MRSIAGETTSSRNAGTPEGDSGPFQDRLQLDRVEPPGRAQGSLHGQLHAVASAAARRPILRARRGFIQPDQLIERQAGDLADRVAPVGEPPEAPQTLDVEVGIEPLAAFATARRDDPVPALPGTEHVWGEPGPLGDEPDRIAGNSELGGLERWACHGFNSTSPSRCCQAIT